MSNRSDKWHRARICTNCRQLWADYKEFETCADCGAPTTMEELFDEKAPTLKASETLRDAIHASRERVITAAIASLRYDMDVAWPNAPGPMDDVEYA